MTSCGVGVEWRDLANVLHFFACSSSIGPSDFIPLLPERVTIDCSVPLQTSHTLERLLGDSRTHNDTVNVPTQREADKDTRTVRSRRCKRPGTLCREIR